MQKAQCEQVPELHGLAEEEEGDERAREHCASERVCARHHPTRNEAVPQVTVIN